MNDKSVLPVIWFIVWVILIWSLEINWVNSAAEVTFVIQVSQS